MRNSDSSRLIDGCGVLNFNSLTNANTGAYRYNDLTVNNSPSGIDVDGLLLVFSVIPFELYIQIFVGYQSNQVYLRYYWYGTFKEWIKLNS